MFAEDDPRTAPRGPGRGVELEAFHAR